MGEDCGTVKRRKKFASSKVFSKLHLRQSFDFWECYKMLFNANHDFQELARNKTRYQFIDGHYFESYCSKPEQLLGVPFFHEIDFFSVASGCDRLYYFDALPVKKENQSDSDFGTDLDKKEKFLDGIRCRPKCHVRDGISRLRGRNKNNRIEQKGVDTLLAIEVLQLIYRNVVDVAEIVTGDIDFYPLFEALQQTKAMGVLVCEERSSSRELRNCPDYVHFLCPHTILESVPREKRADLGILLEQSDENSVTEKEIFRVPE
jgi:uncharacterized LabA/DUF88 family protein